MEKNRLDWFDKENIPTEGCFSFRGDGHQRFTSHSGLWQASPQLTCDGGIVPNWVQVTPVIWYDSISTPIMDSVMDTHISAAS